MASLLERQSRHQTGHAGLGGLSRASFHHSLSQPAAATDNGTPYQSRTLPRQRHRNNSAQGKDGVPQNLASARRKMVSSAVSDYLKSLNSMTRSIVLEREFVEEKHGGEWTAMDEILREEAVNEHFMPSDVRAHYDGGVRPPPVANAAYGRGVHVSSPSRQIEREYREQQREKTLLPRNRGPEIHSNNLALTSSTSYPPQPRTDRDRNNVSDSPAYFISPNYNRLHKNQLSYRSKSRKVVNVPPPQSQKRDSGLGSDGESPRTSDEDLHNSLGFHRNSLRSYSFRHRRAGSRNPNSVLRSSTRKMHKTANDDSNRTNHTHLPNPSSEPNYDNGYDAEVDLPDDSLLLDHVPSQQHEPVAARTPPKPQRYSSRTRRSLRMQPRVLADDFQRDEEEEEEKEEVVIIPNLHPRVSAQDSSSSESAGIKNYHSNVPRFTEQPAIVVPNIRRVQSEDSIDTDIDAVSIAPSNISMLSKSTGILTEDDILSDHTRLCATPDSMLSATSSTASFLSKPKGIVRSRPQSLRGGSSYQTSTSEFANRRAQFKPNMLRKQLSNQNSPSVTREPTPSISTPIPPEGSQQAAEDNKYLLKPPCKSPSPSPCKPPPLSLPMSKHSVEIITADFPTSSENLSQLSSPPHTPLVKSVRLGPPSHLQEIQEQRRESGYISSSSESFAFAARR